MRSHQVIRALKQANPGFRIYIRTVAPEWLFDDSVNPALYSNQAIDVGLIQPNGLQMNLAATLQACQSLDRDTDRLIARELRFIAENKIDLVIGDIPPLAFEIAVRAELPSVAITNFTWDVIYDSYTLQCPDFTPLIETMTRHYGKATLALSLPYPCAMTMFKRRQPIPWITRISKLTRGQARAQFGLPANATVVLLSFGGLGLDMLPWDRLGEMPEFLFVATGAEPNAAENLLVLADGQVCYEDLLRGVDVVVTKPGYGIVADVLSHQLPILYTDRGEFPEYPQLVQALEELATAEYIPQNALLAGDLNSYLEKILAKPRSWPVISLDGANAATDQVLALLEA